MAANCVFLSCGEIHVPESRHEVSFKVKDKRLAEFFNGNRFYSLKGIKSERGDNLEIRNTVLNLSLEDSFIDGFQTGWIFEDAVRFHLHDLGQVPCIPVDLRFNSYHQKTGYFLPEFSRENLEICRNRSSVIYRLDEDLNLVPFYNAHEKHDPIKNIRDIIFHDSSRENLNQLFRLQLYPMANNAFIVVHNPLTNFYTLLPDFDVFSRVDYGVLSPITELMKFESVTERENDTIYLNVDVRFESSRVYKSKTVIIAPGTEFSFVDSAKIIFKNCNVIIEGREEKPILFKGKFGSSLYFQGCELVKLDFCDFEGFSNFVNDTLSLPSSITFYNSHVELSNSSFRGNFFGDDYLNFYNSSFKCKNVKIKDSYADAIDSDFSNGVMIDINMQEVGNDGLDCSGSVLSLFNCSFDRVLDKAVSAGESSELELENTSIKNSELAITVKDGSSLNYRNLSLRDNRIDYAVFFKKDFYPAPLLLGDTLDKSSICLFQEGVELEIKVMPNVAYLNSVENLLYGRTYGKASK